MLKAFAVIQLGFQSKFKSIGRSMFSNLIEVILLKKSREVLIMIPYFASLNII